MGKKKRKKSERKKGETEVEHMLKLHEKVPFGSKVNKNKSICCKKNPNKHSGTAKTSLEHAVGLWGSYQQVLYVVFLNLT